jgi:hypothetical protein
MLGEPPKARRLKYGFSSDTGRVTQPFSLLHSIPHDTVGALPFAVKLAFVFQLRSKGWEINALNMFLGGRGSFFPPIAPQMIARPLGRILIIVSSRYRGGPLGQPERFYAPS